MVTVSPTTCLTERQGEDPGTDFRGGGYLALQCHLYMAAREPELFAALRWKRAGQRSEWEYPFAVAGVNVTFMLVGASVAGLAVRGADEICAPLAGSMCAPVRHIGLKPV